MIAGVAAIAVQAERLRVLVRAVALLPERAVIAELATVTTAIDAIEADLTLAIDDLMAARFAAHNEEVHADRTRWPGRVQQ